MKNNKGNGTSANNPRLSRLPRADRSIGFSALPLFYNKRREVIRCENRIGILLYLQEGGRRVALFRISI